MKLGWKFSLKKMVVLLLALCLLVPQAAFAEEETTLPTWNFNDINAHWAKKHIHKMGLLGITEGYVGGLYKPDNKISRQEAIVMLIKMMGIQDQIDTSVTGVLGIEVSEFAKPYVNLAREKGLLNINEEITSSTAPGLSWGQTNASRQWITKVIIRAIGKQTEAAAAGTLSPGFVDDNKIGTGYAGFINVAKDLKIVAGLNGNIFDPTGDVTRAQMAVFIGNAEKNLTKRNSHIIAGSVDKMDSASITLRTATGMKRLSLASNSVYFDKNSNNAIHPSTFSMNDAVYVIQYGDTAYYVEKADAQDAIQVERFTGELNNISIASQSLILVINGTPRTFTFDATNLTIVNESGSGLSLTQLEKDSTLELIRPVGGTDITNIVVKKLSVSKTTSGTIERIIGGSTFIEIKQAVSGEKLHFEIPNDLDILSATRSIKFADLYVGDEVTITEKDGVITGVTVTKSVVTTLEGKVKNIDATSKIINIQGENNSLVGYYVEDRAIVSITGLSTAKLDDILRDDDVILEINADNKVQKVVVKNRAIEAKFRVEYRSYNDGEFYGVILGDKGKKPEMKELSSATVIEYNGTSVTLDKINTVFKEGQKIDLILSGDRVVRMSNSQKYTGKITNISTTTNTIELDADVFGKTSFTYTQAPFVMTFGKSSTSFNDVRIGDQVQLELDASQDKVQYIQVIQSRLFKVKERLSYKLIVTDEKGTSYDIGNVSSVSISHHDKLFANYNDITIGSYVMVSFTGTVPTAINIPKSSYGVVNAIDATRNTFTYTEFRQAAKTVTDNTTIILNGNAVNSISSLKADDRIQLVEGKDGVRWITVLPKQEKSFVTYTAASKVMQFTIKTLSENGNFILHEAVYIHKDGQVIEPTTLQRNDKLNVYLHDNKVVEIVKQ